MSRCQDIQKFKSPDSHVSRCADVRNTKFPKDQMSLCQYVRKTINPPGQSSSSLPYLLAFISVLSSAMSSVHELKSLKSDSVKSSTERFTPWLSS